MVGAASACTGVLRHDTFSDDAYVMNDLSPDKVLTGWKGNFRVVGGEWGGCPSWGEHRLRFSPHSGSLTYVRDVDVDGIRYPAYGWSDTSPLVVFSLGTSGGFQGSHRNLPMSLHQPTETVGITSGANQFNTFVHYRLISRGGAMTSASTVVIRGISHLPNYPAAGNLDHELRLSVTVPALPCELSDSNLALPAVLASDLEREGHTAGSRELNVRMRCPAAGSHVTLMLEDIHGSTGGEGELTPTADSSAAGVHIRLLRDGQPARMGTPWDHGTSQAGDTMIHFAAQYIRTRGALQPGTLRGEARLTATYR